MSELDALKERLAQLESQINRSRRFTAFSAILGAMAIAGMLYQWSKPADNNQAGKLAPRLQAESFSLVDAAGKVRGQWTVTDKGPAYMMADEKGVERVRIGVIEQGPYVALQDSAGKLTRLWMARFRMGLQCASWMNGGQFEGGCWSTN
jgi:hypothetical protein